jgi:hypothetical protein
MDVPIGAEPPLNGPVMASFMESAANNGVEKQSNIAASRVFFIFFSQS